MSWARSDGARTLLLFDIDGTLVSGATGAHWDALQAALRKVHGVDANALAEPLSPAGRTDGEIARLILRSAGVREEDIDAGSAAVRDECCRAYAANPREDLSRMVLPGVKEVLESLAGRDDVLCALLTGNYEPVARRKLAMAGIGGFFTAGQGAFGSDSEARVDLPALARRRAGMGGFDHPRERTVVIGDTPRDIACAQADGVRCVAVTTGLFGVDELREADGVAQDMRGVSTVLEGWLASSARAW